MRTGIGSLYVLNPPLRVMICRARYSDKAKCFRVNFLVQGKNSRSPSSVSRQWLCSLAGMSLNILVTLSGARETIDLRLRGHGLGNYVPSVLSAVFARLGDGL